MAQLLFSSSLSQALCAVSSLLQHLPLSSLPTDQSSLSLLLLFLLNWSGNKFLSGEERGGESIEWTQLVRWKRRRERRRRGRLSERCLHGIT